jgi:glycosyltransferase involved in cell wall biosynthesis
MKFSLVIPCYNEARSLPLLLERCSKIAVPGEIEIILVDNGSSDATNEILENILDDYPGCRSVRVQFNKGYGFGILEGLRSANGKILGWTHADMQTDPADILRGLKYFDEHGSDIFCKGKRYGRSLMDVFFTVGMSIFESALLKKPLWDINAQPTMFSKDFFDTWESPPEDFSLDLYTYFMAKARNLSVFRFPVKFGERAHGVSHWNISWRAKFEFIKRTLTYSLSLKRSLSK